MDPVDIKTPEQLAAETAAATAAAGGGGGSDSRKVVHLPADALQRRVREEREKGRRQVLSELDQEAKAAGFESRADMVKFLGGLKANPPRTETPPKPVTDPVDPPPQRRAGERGPNRQEREEIARAERMAAQARKEADEAREDARKARKESYRLQRERDYQQTEAELIRVANSVGIYDEDSVELAIGKLKKFVRTKSEEELKAFEDKKFFEGLIEARPDIFKRDVTPQKPATTGVDDTRSPNAQKPAVTTPAGGAALDVSKMKPAELREYLIKRGIDTDFSTNVSIPSLPRGGRAQA